MEKESNRSKSVQPGAAHVPIRFRLLLGFAVPLTIWILVSIANIAVWSQAADNSEKLVSSQQAIVLANQYISASFRTQAAKRGYLMTGDNNFLVRFRAATAEINRIHEQLGTLVAGQPDQKRRLQEAGNLFQEWLYDVARRRIELRGEVSIDLVNQSHNMEKELLILQGAHMRTLDKGQVPHDLINKVRAMSRDLAKLDGPRRHTELVQQALQQLDHYESAILAGQRKDASRALRDAVAMLTRTLQSIFDADATIQSSFAAHVGGGLIEDFHERMETFITAENGRLDRYEVSMRAADERAQFILWAGPALGLVLMVLMTSWMSRRIAHSLEGITRAARGLANGDLSARALVEGSDEFSVLAQRFNSMAGLVENRSRESAALAELGELLQSSTSISEAARIFADLARKLFPGQPGALYLMAPSRDEVVAVTFWGDGAEFSRTEFVPEDCWALRLSRAHENTHDNAVRCAHLETAGDPSVCLPLHAFGETLGMLFVVNPVDGFTEGTVGAEQHRGFTDTVAEQLALALANLRMRETLRHQSIRDPLTQLYNRRYLDETFRRELHRADRRDKPLSVLTFDIDHFKRFNDTHGHDGGDALLKAVGNALRDFFRAEDGAFRSGGEEFVAILPETALKDAMSRAEDLRREISRLEVQHGNLILPAVTISIGVAAFPDHGNTTEQLLKAADNALYEAKDAGRNCVRSAP